MSQPLQVLNNRCPVPPVLRSGDYDSPAAKRRDTVGGRSRCALGEGVGMQAGSLSQDMFPLIAMLQAGRATGAGVEGRRQGGREKEGEERQ